MQGNQLLLSFWYGMYLVIHFIKLETATNLYWISRLTVSPAFSGRRLLKLKYPGICQIKIMKIIFCVTKQVKAIKKQFIIPPPPKKYSVHLYLSNICDYWSIYLIFHACSAEISCSQHLIKFDWTTYRRITSDSMRKKMLSNERKKPIT